MYVGVKTELHSNVMGSCQIKPDKWLISFPIESLLEAFCFYVCFQIPIGLFLWI